MSLHFFARSVKLLTVQFLLHCLALYIVNISKYQLFHINAVKNAYSFDALGEVELSHLFFTDGVL